MRKNVVIGIIVSILLHLILIVSINTKPYTSKESSNKTQKELDDSSNSNKHNSPADKISVSIVEETLVQSTNSIKDGDLTIKTSICKSNKSYIGVGILFYTNVFGLVNISHVAENSPAAKAGITIDDIIIDESVLVKDFIEGEILTLTIKRNETIMKFDMITEKICYE